MTEQDNQKSPDRTKKIIKTFLLLLVLGFASCMLFSNLIQPTINAIHGFQSTTCTVLDKKLIKHTAGRRGGTYSPSFLVKYQVDNTDYSIWTYGINNYFSIRFFSKNSLDGFEKGKTYPCWYELENPGAAFLKRPFDFSKGLWVTLDDFIPFILLGLFSFFFLTYLVVFIRLILDKKLLEPDLTVTAEKKSSSPQTNRILKPEETPLKKLKKWLSQNKKVIRFIIGIIFVIVVAMPNDSLKKFHSFLTSIIHHQL